MRAAKLTKRPSFSLMKQTDIQSVYHLQMPRWLFSDPRYADMNLDAKVAYTFLLNRFQLSRRNGWVNDQGEVFVIFPRKALAAELRICEQRVTAAFKRLVELELIWEKRCGRGDANQIYLAQVTPIDDPAYESAPFLREDTPSCGSRTADPEVLGGGPDPQEPQNPPFQNREFCTSGTAKPGVPEPQNPSPNYIDTSHTEYSTLPVSPSVPCDTVDRQADEEAELMGILDSCELSFFDPGVARVFENAIERLFYSDSFRIGNATLPRSRVRSKLHLLDGMILRDAENKLHANLDRSIRNSTAYVMATVLNCITESESDLLVDPYLNSLRAPPGR